MVAPRAPPPPPHRPIPGPAVSVVAHQHYVAHKVRAEHATSPGCLALKQSITPRSVRGYGQSHRRGILLPARNCLFEHGGFPVSAAVERVTNACGFAGTAIEGGLGQVVKADEDVVRIGNIDD